MFSPLPRAPVNVPLTVWLAVIVLKSVLLAPVSALMLVMASTTAVGAVLSLTVTAMVLVSVNAPPLPVLPWSSATIVIVSEPL